MLERSIQSVQQLQVLDLVKQFDALENSLRDGLKKDEDEVLSGSVGYPDIGLVK